DSRRVRAGDLFFALPGLKQEGAAYVTDALERGAVAAVIGPEVKIADAPRVRVSDARASLARAAAAFHHHPSRALQVVGVTGTNGKTTVTFMMESIFG